MTFNEYTANTKESTTPTRGPSPSPLECLTAHLRAAKLIQDEKKPLEIASALHRQLSKAHEVLMRESEADLNIRRLSFQNLLLSYQALLTISLAAEARGEAA
jgi:hypothetical protein